MPNIKNSNFLAATLTLFSLSGFMLSLPAVNAAVVYPGIYITDTQDRWKVGSGQKSADDQLGYVVCDGGYLGSPLIPNDKKTVDQFLNNCKAGKRLGNGKVPIIDVESNHNPQSAGYEAYKTSFNGKTFNLCHGFLNSTNWCSNEAEKKALALLEQIKTGSKNTQPSVSAPNNSRQAIVQNFSQEAPVDPAQKRALAAEVANEISRTLTPNARREFVPPAQTGPQEKPKQAIQITKDEMTALQNGDIKLEQLLSNNRPVLTLDANNQPQPLVVQQSSIPSSSADLIKQLQEGKISLQDLMKAGQSSSSAGQLTGANSMQLQAIPLQSIATPIQSVASAPQSVSANGSVIQQVQAQNPNAKAVNVTQAELEAIRNGSLSIDQVLSNRPLMSMNQAVQQMSSSSIQAAPPANVVQMNPIALNSPTVQPIQAIPQNMMASAQPVQFQQVAPVLLNPQAVAPENPTLMQVAQQAVQFQQLPPSQGQQIPPPQEIIAQQQQLIVQQQQIIDQQQQLLAPPAQYGAPPYDQMGQAYDPYQQQMLYPSPDNFMQTSYYPGYSSNGVPLSYATTPIYGTHSNMAYPAGSPTNWR
jgi:hypothetical protein